MSEFVSNSKSPKALFEIRKKHKKKSKKNLQALTLINREELIMNELLRLSYKNDYDIQKHSIKRRNKYKMYAADMKQNFIEIAKLSGASLVAKSFNIPLKSLKRWLRNGAERKKGGGRKAKDPEMERKLIEWYNDYHIFKNFPITAKIIKKKALEFSVCKNFTASKGWLEKFKKKYNLVICRESFLKKLNS